MISDLTNGLCVAMAWSSDYSTAVLRSRAAGLDLGLPRICASQR
jgi:hypothetical protein